MPKVKVQDFEIFYEERGSGFPLILGHSLTLDGTMFEPALPFLASSYRVINLDLRGHGKSDAPDRVYTLASMAEDVKGVMTALGLEQAIYAGLSMGGMIGMRLALAYPEKLKALILLDTSGQEEPHKEQYLALAESLKESGPSEPVAEFVLSLLFSENFRNANKEAMAQFKKKMMEANITGSYRASLAVINRENILEELKAVKIPTLILVGEKDSATPLTHAQALHQSIPGSELKIIEGAGHISIYEKPQEVCQEILSFLKKIA